MHPGPRDFPGYDPIGMALYQNAQYFGATLHKILPRVDTGAIIAEQRFAINCLHMNREDIALKAYSAGLELVGRLAGLIADIHQAVPINYDLKWHEGGRTSRKFVREMQRMDLDLTNQELLRRHNAFGDCSAEAGLGL